MNTAAAEVRRDCRPRTKAHRPTVLLVDDDPDQLLLIAAMLRRGGYHVLTSQRAAECFEMLREYPVDLIVSDIRMPDLNGIEFTKLMRSLPYSWRHAEVPIILITAGPPDVEYAAITHGADLFCPKDALPRLLLKQIELLLYG